ncbi:MAG TPA: TPM domain-containing protein, partial [Caulobacter sp.]|nr:TPM domain-containing protein [Caulobacter sp.]
MARLLRDASAALAALALLVLAAPALAAAPAFPRLEGRVVDQANMLSPATEADLTRKLEALETSTGRQLVVVTLPTLQGLEIEDYGYRLGRAWGIGEAKADNGVLLIVAPNQRAVRIEVGYGLEPVLTDALTSVILQSAVLPKFRAGEMEAGVVAGTEALITQLTLPLAEARSVARRAQEAPAESDGGGLPFMLLPVILFVVIMLLSRMGWRRRRSGLMGALPWILLSGLGSG